MRLGAIVVVGISLTVAVVCALTLAGKLPTVSEHIDTLQSSWTEPSSSAPAADAAPVDAAPDVAVKAQAAPLTSAQLSAPLYHVTFLSDCGAPPDMHVTLKVTVKMGRATSAQAITDPPDPGISACIERAASDLHWPASRRSNQVTVRY